jgi:hypothetical protein
MPDVLTAEGDLVYTPAPLCSRHQHGTSRAMHRIAMTIGIVAVFSVLSANHLWGQSFDPTFDQSNDDDSTYTWAVLAMGGIAATTPFWVPFVLTGDRYAETGPFVAYPYKDGAIGNMLTASTPSTEGFPWCLQANTNYAENFSGTRRIDAGFQLEGANRLGIDSELNYWREAVTPEWTRNLWTGNANLLFRFAQCEWLQTRVGIGCNWLDDGGDNDYGFNFTYKADVFLRDPVIISGELDWGTLGDETLFHPRITLGTHWRRAELFIGCDYFDIGSTQATSMIVGARLWY